MLLLIDKPIGMTSHDVVDAVRRIKATRKVGHAGTLDPNASGLLIVGVGRDDTKKLGTIAKDTDKEYVAGIVLGEERDTDDIEGQIVSTNKNNVPSNIEVEKVIASFIGEQSQNPPSFSAIKLNGKKAYQIARKGETPIITPRTITVYEAELLSYKYPNLSVRFTVSSGTYIRALARDIGRALETYAFLGSLRRTRIGEFHLSQAIKLDDLKS